MKLRIAAAKWSNKRLPYWRRPNYRLVPESTYRHMLAVVKAADELYETASTKYSDEEREEAVQRVRQSAAALRSHLAKERKEKGR